jgi:hypothetical protein
VNWSSTIVAFGAGVTFTAAVASLVSLLQLKRRQAVKAKDPERSSLIVEAWTLQRNAEHLADRLQSGEAMPR